MLDDWPRVKAVFEQALAVGGGTTGFSPEACGADAVLRQRVDALLNRTPPAGVPGKQRGSILELGVVKI